MHFFNHILDLFSSALTQAPYLWIFIGMILESTFMPLPSEIIMIPAGYFVATGDIHIAPVLLLGLTGSIIGSLMSYMIGYFWGSTLSIKLLGEKRHDACLRYFKKKGNITIFISRFIPVIRHIISIPAGTYRMNLAQFTLYTALGAGIWAMLLTYFGYFVGNNQEIFATYKHYVLGGAMIIIAIITWAKFIILKKFEK